MLIALPPEHKKNFRRLVDAAKKVEPAPGLATNDARVRHGCCLLRFYAIESGLKYLLSDRLKIPHRHELAASATPDTDHVEGYGHDLARMSKELRVPAAYAAKLASSFRLAGGYKIRGNLPQIFSIAAAHEAWRYGLAVEPSHQVTLSDCLDKLIVWIEQELEA